MAREPNLGLDIVAAKGERAPVARIAVRYALGYGPEGDPLLTPDCARVEELERAVALLVGDLQASVREAAQKLGERPEPEPEPVAAPAAPRGPRPHLDSDVTVAQVMTRDPKTMRRNDKLSVGDELMRVGRFRHVVVVDDDGGIAGVISQNDMMLNALAWHLGQGRKLHERLLETALAKDLMRTDVVTVAPDVPIGEAARLMATRKIGCLPVVSDAGLVGIVTESDLLGLLSR